MLNTQKIALLLISMIILTGCFNKDEKASNNLNTKTVNNVEAPVNKVYEKIADKKEGLKNATSEDLDKIIQEEIKMLNTPISKYPFFEQLSTKKGNIEDIKKAGGMEITRGQVYLHGIDSKYAFINDLLSDNEKLYSFHKENSENNFFFLDGETDTFIKKLKTKYNEFKEVSRQKEFIDLEFKNNGDNYNMQIMLPNQSQRDDMDNILSTIDKSKVIINKL